MKTCNQLNGDLLADAASPSLVETLILVCAQNSHKHCLNYFASELLPETFCIRTTKPALPEIFCIRTSKQYFLPLTFSMDLHKNWQTRVDGYHCQFEASQYKKQHLLPLTLSVGPPSTPKSLVGMSRKTGAPASPTLG